MHEYTVPRAAIALTAAVAKTIVAITTPATRRARLKEFSIGFKSTVSTDEAALVELIRFDTDGTGTAITPEPVVADYPAALCGAKHTYTVEPTGNVTVKKVWRVPVQGGELVYQIPVGDEVEVPISKGLGLRVTCAQAQSADVYLKFDE